MIIASAVVYNGKVYTGAKTHAGVIKLNFPDWKDKSLADTHSLVEKGFICDDGRYLTRTEAFEHAMNVAQELNQSYSTIITELNSELDSSDLKHEHIDTEKAIQIAEKLNTQENQVVHVATSFSDLRKKVNSNIESELREPELWK